MVPQTPADPEIKNVPMGPIVTYRLQKHELDTFKRNAASPLLALGTAFLGAGAGFLGSLLSAQFYVEASAPAPGVAVPAYVPVRAAVLLVLAGICTTAGIVFTILGLLKRGEVSKLVQEISERERAAGTNLGSATPGASKGTDGT